MHINTACRVIMLHAWHTLKNRMGTTVQDIYLSGGCSSAYGQHRQAGTLLTWYWPGAHMASTETVAACGVHKTLAPVSSSLHDGLPWFKGIDCDSTW